RSLASTTPPSHAAATIVVACGRSLAMPFPPFGPFTLFAPGRLRHDPPGSSCGAYADKSSANDDDPRSWRGTLRPHRSRYIPRLLSQPTGTRAHSPPYALARSRRERRSRAGGGRSGGAFSVKQWIIRRTGGLPTIHYHWARAFTPCG